jgi:hypothetical protein
MTNPETVESYLLRCGMPYEQVDESTWVIQLDNHLRSRIAIRIQEPIVLFTAPLMEIADDAKDKEGLYRRLLELNGQLLHSSYTLQDKRVVLSGAQPMVSLDLEEFQAVLDDLTMAMDTHSNELAPWNQPEPTSEA